VKRRIRGRGGQGRRTVFKVALCLESNSASGLLGGSFSSFPLDSFSLLFLEDFEEDSVAAEEDFLAAISAFPYGDDGYRAQGGREGRDQTFL
jgi:hypothetical protein